MCRKSPRYECAWGWILGAPPGSGHNSRMDNATLAIAATAARLIAEDGLEYGPAKHQALKTLGLPARTPLPDNLVLEAALREHLDLFCADTQPGELQALREHAVTWMTRLAEFRPHLGGAVWRGTATRHSDIYLQLFCDDSKSAEIELINQGVDYDVQQIRGFQGGQVDALSVHSWCAPLKMHVGVHLMIYDHDDLRGALRLDAQGQSHRGDLSALKRLLENS